MPLDDIRNTRVYQDAKEEARQEIRQQFWQEKLQSIRMMAADGFTPEDIARIFSLDVDLVRKEIANGDA